MKINAPTGIIRAYAGATAPDGYLLCDGASYLRADYQALFDIIGTAFGAADGTHFNVPDARGRTLVGKNTGVAAFNAVGNTGGSKSIDLSHTHTANPHTHSGSGTSSASGGNNPGTSSSTNVANASHTHTVTVNTGNQTATASDSQLSAGQSILNPYTVLNWIIRI